ncbi:uncharacterized protein LOC131154597 [Malania oleifera]|uniref:uncharacterized protein LOC131154597 n=1 Tax=Malania oleifera TaxID=397392 RepID=UPI0025AE678A|nr:uncharacterized protein LOC131154597 [Malania oleifera]
MRKQFSLTVDAWIREAEEAGKLVEDLEARIKNNNPEEARLRDSARSKLSELAVKLDRLESLLHNPPSKPLLTDQDLDFRWKMLSDMQLRTKAVALSVFTFSSMSRPASFPTEDTKEKSKAVNSSNQDHLKTTSFKGDPELLEPLVLDNSTQSQVQLKLSSSFMPKSCLLTTCWVILLTLGAAALLVLLVIVCAVI